jgi:hypothetical protein
MTQSFFQHFNCRQLSPDLSVLSRDYDEICYATLRWKVLAAVAIFGMIFVSIGVPIGMFIWMRRVMSTKIRAVRSGDVKRVTAYRDFDRKFRFMAGEFRPEAYYAECVDLLRKLIMTGALGLIPPGTVFQGYCSVMFSLTFLMAHAKLWPYPSMAANLLKLFTDVQVFLVTLTGLILKIDRGTTQDSISHGFGWTGSLYGDLMWVLLVLTTIPTALALVYKSPIEKAQRFLHKTARVDLDDEASAVAQRRQTLRQRMQDSTASRDATAGTGTRTGRDSYRSDEPKSRHDGKATDFGDFETKSGLGDAELGAAPPASAAEPATLSSNQIASSRGGTPPRSRKKPPPQLPVAQEVSSIARVKSHPKPPPLSGMKRTATEEAPPSPSEPLQSPVQASPVRPRVAPPPLAGLQRRRQHP